MEIMIEMISVILCANPLTYVRHVPAPCLFECERPVERVRVFHCYDRGQSPGVLADREPGVICPQLREEAGLLEHIERGDAVAKVAWCKKPSRDLREFAWWKRWRARRLILVNFFR